MNNARINNPPHGITLETILTRLGARYGWKESGRLINGKCFSNDPGIRSGLKVPRKTPWAGEKVEALSPRSPEDE